MKAKRFLCALLLLAGIGGAHAAYSITDDSGHVTHFDAPPARIVSLLPSITETVCALGDCGRLVGVDRYSDWPPEVRRLPDLGGGLDPSLEAVVALQPNVVLIGTSSRAVARLRALGLKVLALQPDTLASMRTDTERLGKLRQVPTGALLERIAAGIKAAAQSIPRADRGQSVYFEVSPAPYAAGRTSFIGELLHELGLKNIIGPTLGVFPKINPEFVVQANPDLILVSGLDADELARRPGWSAIRAIREGHVCRFDAAQRNILVRPGPRIPEAAQLIAQCAAHAPIGIHR